MTKMRELAQKATPDLWAESYTTKDGKVEIVFSESYRTNAAFIAACSPERILAYEDCVEALAGFELICINSGSFARTISGKCGVCFACKARAALAALDALEEP